MMGARLVLMAEQDVRTSSAEVKCEDSSAHNKQFIFVTLKKERSSTEEGVHIFSLVKRSRLLFIILLLSNGRAHFFLHW